ncbi:hypothetical protein [Streptomyces sp. TN58]|uniref:hypothetical protein n=1 Tax=Streptomyces sp. TN58 TaxID=234612 RepID=UPI00095095F5|nr:hypothetical protein [Streptomyces sp. TN58]APU43691.1 hypothetical protein BSL84_32075 [Streptomyces sp. TN58]
MFRSDGVGAAEGRRAYPDTDVTPDDALASIDDARLQRRRQAAVAEAAALRRVRAERAGANRAVGASPPAAGIR